MLWKCGSFEDLIRQFPLRIVFFKIRTDRKFLAGARSYTLYFLTLMALSNDPPKTLSTGSRELLHQIWKQFQEISTHCHEKLFWSKHNTATKHNTDSSITHLCLTGAFIWWNKVTFTFSISWWTFLQNLRSTTILFREYQNKTIELQPIIALSRTNKDEVFGSLMIHFLYR